MNPIASLVDYIETKQLWEVERIYRRSEFLTEQGKRDTNLYFILSGSVRIYILDGESEHTIRFGYQGSIIGALDSFLHEKPTDYFIQSIKKTKVKIISKSTFMSLIENNRDLNKAWNQLLVELIQQQMEREKDLLTAAPSERYKRVLERSPQLFQEIPTKYIASYLRMTPETLSRIKKS
jgi:CRP-like cAMP-binding protein